MAESDSNSIVAESEIDAFIKKRTAIKSALTRFETYLSKFTGSDNVLNLKGRLSDAKTILDKYNTLQSKIEDLDPDTDYEAERSRFEDRYYDIIASAETKIGAGLGNLSVASTATGSGSSDNNNPDNNAEKRVKLPTISIAKYDGSYQGWSRFRDSFKTLIHDNTELSNVQKYLYLQSSLSGKAAETINALEISDQNYKVAWKILCERFENKRLIVFEHIKGIFEIVTLQKESSVGLRHLLDEYFKHTRALVALQVDVSAWGILLLQLVTSKFDLNTRKLWETEMSKRPKELPTLAQLEDFLKARCDLLEAVSACGDKVKQQPRAVTNHSVVKCVMCKGSHTIYQCKNFLSLNVEGKREEIKRLNLCFNCLASGHSVKNCKCRSCKICHRKHNDLLHFENKSERSNSEAGTTIVPENSQAQHVAETSAGEDATLHVSGCATDNVSGRDRDRKIILLATVNILVYGNNDKAVVARALLDTGSSANYISKNFVSKLNVKTLRVSSMHIAGVNNSSSIVNAEVVATVKSRCSNFKARTKFLVVDKVTEDLPLCSFERDRWDIPSGICLADDSFNLSNEIDILLGAQISYDAFLSGSIRNKEFVLRETVFGWVAVGALNWEGGASSTEFCCLARAGKDVLEKEECETFFEATTLRDADGRFVVSYPTNENLKYLKNNFDTTLAQFLNLEVRLNKNKPLKEQYVAFMSEYLRLGHMEKYCELNSSSEINDFIQENRKANELRCVYIPHHPIIKEYSSTTKLRVVFNGSSKASKGQYSLNDCLKNGPVVQNELFKILLRFRKHEIVLTADMEKMYRQIWVNKRDRDLQRIIWRESTDAPVGIFRLKTVTYGLKPSGYLATRCIKQLADNAADEMPDAARSLLNDSYIDDLITGCDTIQQAIEFKNQIDTILASAGLCLRKWRSNSSEFLDYCKLMSSETKHFIKNNSESKTLGIYWEAADDSLRFLIELPVITRVTKRSALSVVAQLFDPLGLVGPIVVVAKLFVQRLWSQGLHWDEELPSELQLSWEQLQTHLSGVNQLEIPRKIFSLLSVETQLLGFCDASLKAYGCAVYLRCTDTLGRVTVRLVWARSRLAPLSKRGKAQVTLPRLELNGALLLAENIHLVAKELGLPFDGIFCWTDSTIVLSWLRRAPNTWKPYVANRVNRIQSLTEGYSWRHVSSRDNPADLISRGADVKELKKSIWFEGPSWLKGEIDGWPAFHAAFEESEVLERRIFAVSNVTSEKFELFTKFSSLKRLRRVIGWCLRFINNVKGEGKRISDPILSIEELDDALKRLLKLAQKESFFNEFESLLKGRPIAKSSKILALDPFVDEFGLMRVGGRIKRGGHHFDKCHPIILPKGHYLTKLIIKNEHLKNLHAGPQFLLAEIREKYWPISGLTVVKRVIRECVVCIRFNAKTLSQKMGDLPKNRLVPSFPFQYVNIDYCGPFDMKERGARNRRIVKTYVCIFICQSTKAIHLELANDLSASAFLNCFVRFIGRRGLCSEIISDNATNFVAADKYLKGIQTELKNNENSVIFKNYLAENKITWRFLPKRSPHFGGLHESAVKLFKSHFRKVLFLHKTLAFETMYTIICQIEAILNSRPLTPLSSDPQDVTALTPGHFLIGRRLDMIAERSLEGIKVNRLDNYQLIRKIIEAFWKEWSKQYLSTLQPKSKWRRSRSNSLKIGDLVILRDSNLPPQHWRLGRISGLRPGRDGFLRVVDLYTSTGSTSRAITELVPLVCDETDSEATTSAGEDVEKSALFPEALPRGRSAQREECAHSN